MGLEAGQNIDALNGNFDLSNFVIVNRNGLNAGILSGGPYEFVIDGRADMIAVISLDDTEVNRETQTYVITD